MPEITLTTTTENAERVRLALNLDNASEIKGAIVAYLKVMVEGYERSGDIQIARDAVLAAEEAPINTDNLLT